MYYFICLIFVWNRLVYGFIISHLQNRYLELKLHVSVSRAYLCFEKSYKWTYNRETGNTYMIFDESECVKFGAFLHVHH